MKKPEFGLALASNTATTNVEETTWTVLTVLTADGPKFSTEQA
jgi:hypothetical protein